MMRSYSCGLLVLLSVVSLVLGMYMCDHSIEFVIHAL